LPESADNTKTQVIFLLPTVIKKSPIADGAIIFLKRWLQPESLCDTPRPGYHGSSPGRLTGTVGDGIPYV
jgi:hypothetical protein